MASYRKEVDLLNRLRGNERIIQLIHWHVTAAQDVMLVVRHARMGRCLCAQSIARVTLAAVADVVHLCGRGCHRHQIMECGEIDLANMLMKRQGTPLDIEFVRGCWEQVGRQTEGTANICRRRADHGCRVGAP